MSQATILNARENRTLRAINDVLYPAGGTIPYSANEVGVCGYVDQYLARLESIQRLGVRLLLLFLEFAPLLFLRAKSRFSSLDVEHRQTFLEWMECSPVYFLRIALVSIRTIVGMGFLADERVLTAMGYFKNCAYPGDARKIPTWKDVPGAEAIVSQEVRDAG